MPAEWHEGIAGVTFDSDGHRLAGVLYLARGDEPKPTVLLPHGCPGLERSTDLAVALRDRLGQRPGPLDVIESISPRPVLIVHGSEDAWVPVTAGRLLASRARPPSRYAEIAGANHAFAWHRADLCDLVIGWLAEMDV